MPERLVGGKPAEVGHYATEHREGGNERFEETPGVVWVDQLDAPTVGRFGARLARKVKILRYAFVASPDEAAFP